MLTFPAMTGRYSRHRFCAQYRGGLPCSRAAALHAAQKANALHLIEIIWVNPMLLRSGRPDARPIASGGGYLSVIRSEIA